MRTKLHVYKVRPDSAAHKIQRQKIAQVMSAGAKAMIAAITPAQAIATQVLDGKEILLNTQRLFRHGWQTEIGFLFDWHEEPNNGKDVFGYWLEPSTQMVIERLNRLECGYCLHQYVKPGDFHQLPTQHTGRYCKRCLGDEHLKNDLLPLIELQTMDKQRIINAVTDPELFRLYNERQEQERQLRFDRMKLSELAKLREVKDARDIEYKGKVHLLDLGIDVSAVSYINGSFMFTNGLTREQAAGINQTLKNASFAYPFELHTMENVRTPGGSFKQRLTAWIDSYNE